MDKITGTVRVFDILAGTTRDGVLWKSNQKEKENQKGKGEKKLSKHITAVQPHSSAYAASCDMPGLLRSFKIHRLQAGTVFMALPFLFSRSLCSYFYRWGLGINTDLSKQELSWFYVLQGQPIVFSSALWLMLQLGEYDSSSKEPGTWTLTGGITQVRAKFETNTHTKRSLSFAWQHTHFMGHWP